MKGKEKKRRQRKETIIQIITTKRNRNRKVAMGGSETMKRLQTAA